MPQKNDILKQVQNIKNVAVERNRLNTTHIRKNLRFHIGNDKKTASSISSQARAFMEAGVLDSLKV